MKNLFTLLILFTALSSCSSDDCSSYADSPVPFFASIQFEDAETGENLLLNGKITANDIKLKGSETNLVLSPRPGNDTPTSSLSFNFGTDHQQAKIYLEYTIHDKPAFTVSFNADEVKTNNKCSQPRHYFHSDQESLKITSANGFVSEYENGEISPNIVLLVKI